MNENSIPIHDSLPADYYRRVEGVLKPELVHDQRVLVVGCGSGGARVADELVRTGIGGVGVLDLPGETLELHNVVRHVLGFSSVGEPKPAALATYLRNLRPDAAIDAIEMDVAAAPEPFADLVARKGYDLLVIATDNDPSRYVVNQTALDLGLPFVAACVYHGGVGGEVFRHVPAVYPACYGCLSLQVGRESQPRKAVNIDYTDVEASSREARSASALNLDIATVTNLQARVVLYTLVRESLPEFDDLEGANYIRFANRRHGSFFEQSLAASLYRVDPHPGCLLCGGRPSGAPPDSAMLAAAG